jgi:hypothetical protein
LHQASINRLKDRERAARKFPFSARAIAAPVYPCFAAMGQPMVTSVIWPDRSRPICPVLPESPWDSQRLPRKNQTSRNVKHSKSPNALFQVILWFARKPCGFIPPESRYGMRVNYLYGFNDQQPQTWVSQNLYVILWLGVLWLVAFLPTHLALRKIFAAAPPVAGRKITTRFLISSLPAGQGWIH